jgi:hypothetical protein
VGRRIFTRFLSLIEGAINSDRISVFTKSTGNIKFLFINLSSLTNFIGTTFRTFTLHHYQSILQMIHSPHPIMEAHFTMPFLSIVLCVSDHLCFVSPTFRTFHRYQFTKILCLLNGSPLNINRYNSDIFVLLPSNKETSDDLEYCNNIILQGEQKSMSDN